MDHAWIAQEATGSSMPPPGPPPPGVIRAGGSGDDFAWHGSALAADTIQKALTASRATRPAQIKHNVSLAARRYMHAFTGVIDQATPHLDYTILRRLSERNPVLNAVVNTLLNQTAAYFVRPEHPKAIGVRVVQKGKNKPLTPGAAKMQEYLEDILFNGGIPNEHPKTGQVAPWDGHWKRKGMKLDHTVRLLMRDSLVMDQVFVATEGGRKIGGKVKHPVVWWGVEDAALMRYADREEYVPRVRTEGPSAVGQGMVEYVMLDPMASRFSVIKEYTWRDGTMAHRNPRSEFGAFGYGQSEIEQCLDCVLGILNSLQANKEYFTDNHVPLGILNLIGNYGDTDLKQLRMKFRNEIGLPGHFWEFPIIATPPGQGAGAEFIPMQARDRMDMIFRAYIEFCVAIAAAVFQISPEEFGFGGFGGPQNTLSEADPSSTLQHSQHKGLVPKVKWLSGFLSETVVERIDPDWEIRVQGLEAVWTVQEQAALQRDGQLLAMGYTPNMIRKLNDEPPLVDPLNSRLWREVETYIENTGQWFPSERDRVAKTIEVYETLGGEMGSFYEAPVGMPHALEFWAMEHQSDLMMQQQVLPAMLQGEAEGARAAEADQRTFEHQRGMADTQHQQGLQMEEAKGATAEKLAASQHTREVEKLGIQGQQQMQQVEMKGGIDAALASLSHEQALALAQVTSDTKLQEMLLQHAHEGQMAGEDRAFQGQQQDKQLQHQSQIEDKKQAGQEKLQGGQQRHELGMAAVQHQGQRQLAHEDHGRQMELAEQGHGHALEQQAQGHQQALQQGEQGHLFALHQQAAGHEQQVDLAQLDHELQSITQAIQHGQQVDLTRLQSALQMAQQAILAEQGHGHTLAQGEQQHEQATDQAVLQAILSQLQGEQQHEHRTEEQDQKHGHALQQVERKGEVDRKNQEAKGFQDAFGGVPMVEDAVGGLTPGARARFKARGRGGDE